MVVFDWVKENKVVSTIIVALLLIKGCSGCGSSGNQKTDNLKNNSAITDTNYDRVEPSQAVDNQGNTIELTKEQKQAFQNVQRLQHIQYLKLSETDKRIIDTQLRETNRDFEINRLEKNSRIYAIADVQNCLIDEMNDLKAQGFSRLLDVKPYNEIIKTRNDALAIIYENAPNNEYNPVTGGKAFQELINK